MGVPCQDGGCTSQYGILLCGAGKGGTCDCQGRTCSTDRPHVCQQVQARGEHCDATANLICNAPGYFCGFDHLCHQAGAGDSNFLRLGEGEVCRTETSSAMFCDQNLYCSTDGYCRKKPGLGEPCSAVAVCDGDLRCASGFDDGTCR
jgi:hypothetical protein